MSHSYQLSAVLQSIYKLEHLFYWTRGHGCTPATAHLKDLLTIVKPLSEGLEGARRQRECGHFYVRHCLFAIEKRSKVLRI